MSLYCDDDRCPDKENCFRYTYLFNIKARGIKCDVLTINKEICDTNRAFYYDPIRKEAKK